MSRLHVRLALLTSLTGLFLAGCGAAGINLNGLDWGDAPAPYPTIAASGPGGGRHAIVLGMFLGGQVDPEGNGQPNASSTGDDVANGDDEDGVTFGPLIPGQTATVTIVASIAAKLDAWVDFGNDGSWATPGDQVFINEPLPAGSNVWTFAVPAGAVSGGSARFRYGSEGNLAVTGLAKDGEVEDYQIQIADPSKSFDWGDAPDGPYPTLAASNGASHAVSGNVMLGSQLDNEQDGQPNGAATGDDVSPLNFDDEDGVTFTSPLIVGQPATMLVTASGSGIGKLDAWIDFNHDGSWATAGDQIMAGTVLSFGSQSLTFTIPATASTGATYARFRVSTAGGLSFTGLAADGEVEDYRLALEGSSGGVVSRDWGDAPDGPHPTLAASNGARHVIANNLFLGASVDAEPDGQPIYNFLGDDEANSPDDEDGVTFTYVNNQVSNIIVVASAPGKLDAWMDFNNDGSWATPGDQIFTSFPLVAGSQTLTFLVPPTAVVSGGHCRFRLSSAGGLSFTGQASDGEVEDYRG